MTLLSVHLLPSVHALERTNEGTEIVGDWLEHDLLACAHHEAAHVCQTLAQRYATTAKFTGAVFVAQDRLGFVQALAVVR